MQCHVESFLERPLGVSVFVYRADIRAVDGSLRSRCNARAPIRCSSPEKRDVLDRRNGQRVPRPFSFSRERARYPCNRRATPQRCPSVLVTRPPLKPKEYT
ncbi:hypothetical protein MRX96_013421 [Rhipicephalus microplus]